MDASFMRVERSSGADAQVRAYLDALVKLRDDPSTWSELLRDPQLVAQMKQKDYLPIVEHARAVPEMATASEEWGAWRLVVIHGGPSF